MILVNTISHINSLYLSYIAVFGSPNITKNKVPFTSTSLRIPDEYSPPVRPHPIKGKITASINESHCHCDRQCLDLENCVEVWKKIWPATIPFSSLNFWSSEGRQAGGNAERSTCSPAMLMFCPSLAFNGIIVMWMLLLVFKSAMSLRFSVWL